MEQTMAIDKMDEEKLKQFVEKFYFMVRDCDFYKQEYKECKSFKGRFHQNFIYGEYLDCSKWKEDMSNCHKYVESDDLKAGASIIQNEIKRLQNRVNANVANDVWTKRSEPPSNWNSKLPSWLENRQKNAFPEDIRPENDMCVIS